MCVRARARCSSRNIKLIDYKFKHGKLQERTTKPLGARDLPQQEDTWLGKIWKGFIKEVAFMAGQEGWIRFHQEEKMRKGKSTDVDMRKHQVPLGSKEPGVAGA